MAEGEISVISVYRCRGRVWIGIVNYVILYITVDFEESEKERERENCRVKCNLFN